MKAKMLAHLDTAQGLTQLRQKELESPPMAPQRLRCRCSTFIFDRDFTAVGRQIAARGKENGRTHTSRSRDALGKRRERS